MATPGRLDIRQPNRAELQQVLALRHLVLDAEHGQPTETSLSAMDYHAGAIHIAAFDDGQVIGTVRLQPHEGDPLVYLVRKMATHPDHRGRGVGAQVLAAAEAEAAKRGARSFMLHSRVKAVPFYERAGYFATGQTATHGGDTNITMTKPVPVTAAEQRPPISIKGIVYEDGRLWLRRNEFGKWELPGGRIEAGEQPEDTVIREIREELGLEVTVERLIDAAMWYKDWGRHHEIMIVTYRCRLVKRVGEMELIGEGGPAEFQRFDSAELEGLDLPEPYRRAISRD